MNDAVTRETLMARLQDALGAAAVLSGESDTAGYTQDWRGRYRGDALCVVLPSTTEQVSTVVKLCAAAGVPILPQGGNTSLCGGAVPPSGGPTPVLLNLARMRRIRQVDAANGSMIVEAGCILKTVQETAAGVGRLYPVSLGAEGSCQIGGTLSTNAGGTSVLRYGNTRENVLGLEVVLADGTVWDGLRALRKDNTGIDLKHLFIGAEGTLGVITAAALKLHALPTHHALAWFAPRDPAAALRILGMFQRACASRLSAFEIMNRHQLELVLAHVPNRRNPLGGTHAWHVLVELGDTRDAHALEAVLTETLGEAVEQGLVDDAVIAANETQRADLWEVRHSVSEANKKAAVGLTTDCAVPVSSVPEFIEAATRAVHAIVPGLDIAIVGHMGDGNVHFIPMFSFEAWAALADSAATGDAMRACVNDVAARLAGTFSAEHGVGQTGLPLMQRYKSTAELALMRTLKAALDPNQLFNPGRLVP
ncbi:FAD-binding oxidoreductase [Pandoraea nosoerga]|uniref:2-hydroxyacid dehydrogenase n=1 Tax=Pandoraea nosoerga TaxID=2508296 RepID=A0A5E4W6F4_9BURK|nr:MULTISPECIES: FAD-binding oxidoreductase [Pandoraea]MBN4666294.1 FAD-binding oxidoreductase [Pandoraea nosoerga]MBN4676349.1 FAD-binding oxidoreductase [Pandoraea nosoerga]MBN4681386.1 FAD-binding oxidoreductase [Pandoraea nosoerga]MBN4745460.1 FAD-binding oxidoreductase [Pandoraea nosoerga]VVE18840.1 2-hydroxyacid dehydrogenase [Pandoraea nosoerga]